MRPGWLKVEVSAAGKLDRVVEVLRRHRLHTVCQAANCPNLPRCWGTGTATFMILGDVCTRTCRFCATRVGWPGRKVDPEEPTRIAAAVRELGLSYVVITSVDRDDLPDGGAAHWARTIRAVQEAVPGITVEALIPDFSGARGALEEVLAAGPAVVGHNIETVRRLTPQVRDPRASYELSLEVLRAIKELSPGIITKSSLLLGLGEGEKEIRETLRDLLDAGVDILVLGQYLRPGPRQVPVSRYLPPGEFMAWREEALRMGFRAVVAGPLVRTSFRAREVYRELICG
ncbi:lipoyl synthase [Candidatus Bipolaricaulota sp. J31]